MSKEEMDNDVDDIFKDSLGQIKIDPPKEFWDDARANILARSNKALKPGTSVWKGISFALLALVFVLSFFVFYFYKETRNNENAKRFVTTESTKNSEEISNAKSVEPTQNTISAPTNKTVSNKEPVHSAIAYSALYSDKKKSTENHSAAHKVNTVSASKTFRNNNNYDEQSYSVNASTNEKPVANSRVESASSNKVATEAIASKQPIQSTSSGLIKEDPIIPGQKPDTAKSVEPQYVNSEVSSKPTPFNTIIPKDTQNIVNTSSSFAIAAFFAPDVMDKCYYKGNGSSSEISGNDLKNYEKNNFSYSTGVKAEIALSKHWAVSAGLSYHAFSSRYNPEEVYYQKQSDGSMGYSVVTSSGVIECPNYGWGKPGDSLSINGTSSRNYIGIPILVKYRFAISHKLSGYVAAGGAANFAMQSVTTMHWQDSWQRSGDATVNSMDALNNAYYSFYAGIGAEYSLTKRFLLYLEPSLQGGITPMSKNSPIISYPYSIPVAFGAVYHLN